MSPDEGAYGDPGRGDGHADPYGRSGPGGSGQTRTRLPDYADDRQGGPRRPARSSSRGLVTVVGIVVLLIAAIAFANRGGDEPSTARPDTERPKADSTAASGTRPVDGQQGGIATGFARDAQGAQSAAANYAVALGSADMFDKPLRDAIITATHVPNAAAERRADLDEAYGARDFLERIGLNPDGGTPDGQTFVSRTIPVGTKAEESTADTATVAVWHTSLFGLAGESSKNPVTESWYTTTYTLRWTDGDWKIADFDQQDGPVPTGRDQRASTADDLAKAVEEYGGFTYAR
ncbi:hypothetical protein ACFV0R_11970 [Streptomyces sp. NPDC059578]|uniref:hypothetical protein n=1 Tax=Streptomyces sp. NPDC059578 TaxID=3346874 RepID=UPI00369CB437